MVYSKIDMTMIEHVPLFIASGSACSVKALVG